MARRPLVAGNWKMHGSLQETRDLLGGIVEGAGGLLPRIDLLVLPPFTALAEAGRLLAGAGVRLGAQDLFWEPCGAFTGEISGSMLREAGCTHVLVGHSERRAYFGESGETLYKKAAAALREGLTPVFCLGELLDAREAGRTEPVLAGQLEEVILRFPAEDVRRFVVAYEPVWAIGTGRNATPEQAEAAHGFIRGAIADRFGGEVAGALPILYGGSVNPGNAAGLLTRPGVDGALVGGSSLRAAEFLSIAEAAAAAAGG